MAGSARCPVIFRYAVSSHYSLWPGNGDAMELSLYRRKILSYLRKHPSASQPQLAAHLGCDRKTVCRHLKSLKDANLIRVRSGQFRGVPNTYEVI